jgi:hypothetical protein
VTDKDVESVRATPAVIVLAERVNDSDDVVGDAGDPVTAAAASTMPPVTVRPDRDGRGRTVLSSRAFNAVAEMPGTADFTNAAAPVTNGVAIEVPSRKINC